MRVLLIEDDRKITQFVEKGLMASDFVVDMADTGSEGLHMALYEDYDVLVIDIMLPGIDGITVIERIRAKHNYTPVIILSARDRVDDRVKGLEAGADDYLTKPFAFSELLARIKALMRRSGNVAEPNLLSCSDLTLDVVRREVKRAGRTIDLQPKEFSLLEYLLRNKGRVVSKTMIMQHVWNYNFDPMTNVVEARMCMLRDKIEKRSDSKLIHTVRGAGYVLKAVDDDSENI